LSSCRAIRKFLEKLTDVVGLYLNPPDKAIVLCVDEKSQIQALNRTQPGRPLKPGRCGAMTHDYKRNGTTTLFAALDLLQAKVIGDFHQRHRHQEFLKFLRRMDRELPGGKTLHLVMDNYGTHGHAEVKAWLKKHPRFVIHYVPTSCSWLNLVERWFAELTSKWIRRGSFYSVDELIAAIREFLAAWNENPKPFLWTATLDCHPGLHRRQTRPLPPNPGTDSARLYRPQEPQTFVQLIRGHYTSVVYPLQRHCPETQPNPARMVELLWALLSDSDGPDVAVYKCHIGCVDDAQIQALCGTENTCESIDSFHCHQATQTVCTLASKQRRCVCLMGAG